MIFNNNIFKIVILALLFSFKSTYSHSNILNLSKDAKMYPIIFQDQ